MERLASNGMEEGAENGELLSLKDHAEYQDDTENPSPRRKISASGE